MINIFCNTHRDTTAIVLEAPIGTGRITNVIHSSTRRKIMYTLMHSVHHHVRGLFVSAYGTGSSETQTVTLEKARGILGNDSIVFPFDTIDTAPTRTIRRSMSNGAIFTLPYSQRTLEEVATRKGVAVWNDGREIYANIRETHRQYGVEIIGPSSLLGMHIARVQPLEWIVLAVRNGLIGSEYHLCERSLVSGTVIPDVYTLIRAAASVFHTQGRALFGGRRLFTSSMYDGQRILVYQSHDGQKISLALVNRHYKAPGLGTAILWQPFF